MLPYPCYRLSMCLIPSSPPSSSFLLLLIPLHFLFALACYVSFLFCFCCFLLLLFLFLLVLVRFRLLLLLHMLLVWLFPGPVISLLIPTDMFSRIEECIESNAGTFCLSQSFSLCLCLSLLSLSSDFLVPVLVGIVMSVKALGSDHYPYAEALKERGDIDCAKLASLG